MARSISSLRLNMAARAISALMRSGFAVLSLSIRPPHSAAILSSSLADMAAKHGAGSIAGSLSGSVPVAKPRLEKAVHASRETTAAIRILKQSRIKSPQQQKYLQKGLPQNQRRRAAIIHTDFKI